MSCGAAFPSAVRDCLWADAPEVRGGRMTGIRTDYASTNLVDLVPQFVQFNKYSKEWVLPKLKIDLVCQ